MPSQKDIYQRVTAEVIQALEAGTHLPWKRPWITHNDASLSSGNDYRGINKLLLAISSSTNGYNSRWWSSYRGIQANGGQVRRGEKATKIVFYRTCERKRLTAKGIEKIDRYPIIREHSVFNVDQADGLDEFKANGNTDFLACDTDYSLAASIVSATEADIRHGGAKAFYSPVNDFIQMPAQESFAARGSASEYWHTLLHELYHWSEPRLKAQRDDSKAAYAFHEISADMAASFLATYANIPFDETNSIAYIQSWAKALRNDNKLIFRCSSAASKASDFILSFSKLPNKTTAEPVEEEIPF